jgi:hypothetical protein
VLIFLLIVLCLFGAALWLLTIPIDVKFRFDTQNKEKTSLQVHWFYGLLRRQFKATISAPSAPPIKSKISRRRRSARSDKRGRRFVWGMLKSQDFLSRVLRYIIETLRTVEFRDNSFFMQLGLHDPADTGQAAGLLGPLLGCIPNARFEPDFYEACFVLQVNSTMRIVPFRFVKLAVLLVCAPELWRAVQSGIKAAR